MVRFSPSLYTLSEDISISTVVQLRMTSKKIQFYIASNSFGHQVYCWKNMNDIYQEAGIEAAGNG